jgi:hypothetical protein
VRAALGMTWISTMTEPSFSKRKYETSGSCI